MRLLLASLLVIYALFHATPAGAQGTQSTDPPEGTVRSPIVWYGWQILVVDASALGLTFLSTRASGAAGTASGVLGVGAYLAGGSIIHAVHRRPGAIVAGSVALRLVLPLLGAFVGAAAAHSAVSECESGRASSGDGQSLTGLCGLTTFGYAAAGAGIGALAASILDVTALAWTPSAAPRSSWNLRVTSGVVRSVDDRRVMTFGVMGTL
jgi:hypothetical protein